MLLLLGLKKTRKCEDKVTYHRLKYVNRLVEHFNETLVTKLVEEIKHFNIEDMDDIELFEDICFNIVNSLEKVAKHRESKKMNNSNFYNNDDEDPF
jgi:predicted house-cleaning noncanonical NTP pyrophosphatase (MazG superfamily)